MKRCLVTHHDVGGKIEIPRQRNVAVTAAAGFRNVPRIHGRSADLRWLDLVFAVTGGADWGGHDSRSHSLAVYALPVPRIDLAVARSTDRRDGLSECFRAGSLHLVHVAMAD